MAYIKGYNSLNGSLNSSGPIRTIGEVVAKIIYCVAVFFASLFILSGLMNRGNTDMTMSLKSASLPLVSYKYENILLNTMHGYTSAMNTAMVSDEITPLMAGRKISLYIESYGTKVDKVSYELRSIDGTRLIEDTTVYNYLNDNGIITADITLKDLIDKDVIYSMCVMLDLSTGQKARYYSKIIYVDEPNITDKLQYAYYFSKTSFDKIKAHDELKVYMESNSKGDNSSFHKVNIHSSMEQLTWGNLNPELECEMRARLLEFDSQMAVIAVDYYVSTGEKEKKVYYEVNDTYRVRMGKERLFLLNFEREMSQIFSLSSGTINNNKIVYGINDANVNMEESTDGNQVAFVLNSRLYSYNITDNKMSVVFQFYDDGRETDIRDSYSKNDIRVFNIDESGNIYFAVYGYMNRGIHEGQMGVAFYYYDSVINNTEEKLFIEYNKNYDLLKQQIDTLCFANTVEQGYIFLDDTIYSLDLQNSRISVLVQNIPFGGLIVSDDYQMAAYISGGDLYNSTQIIILNLVTGQQTYVQAGEENRIMTIGFFDKDLVYGIAAKKDIYMDDNGQMIFPMNTIIIRDEKGNTLKEYSQDNIYVLDTSINNTMVSLERGVRTENGFEKITGDQILNNKPEKTSKNTSETVVTENFETIVQIVLRKNVDTKSMKVLTPKQIIYEGNRTVRPEIQDLGEVRSYYYVYAMGKLLARTDYSGDAIKLAYENDGSVQDDSGHTIYKRMSVKTRNQIMSLNCEDVSGVDSSQKSMAVCLDKIISLSGKSSDTYKDIVSGDSPYEILGNNLEGAYIVELTGCEEEVARYYLEKDIPVLVVFRDGSSVLLTGYNEIADVVLDPSEAILYKEDVSTISNWFKTAGNRVITYIYPDNK